ncbi:unnamed protein product [Sphenostylis stenocarpa]|uniref:PORR domain-containing protein n=1 Tax=Sphenostylis stenocarpa TaxID=92480 RepID=A0AA86T7A8_9FABA|nr:unnamed protein product [Sphenostylis stenocarpa]
MPQPRATRFLLLLSRPSSTRNLPPPPPNHYRVHVRTIFDGNFKPVRDRGLDHAVEREKNLKPLLSLKNLMKREPTKSLPLSIIKNTLHFPFRSIEFIRKYPSVFEEFLPIPTLPQPHIRLTPETLRLDADEQLINQSHQFKHQSADKLLKLLMIARIHKIPLPLIEHLQWDLGLPDDYAETVVPEFPDYFRIADGFLELVCWSHELAVSVLQNRNRKDELDDQLVFPVQFSTGFEMDKKYDKWLREWQRLPYVSPYENVSHLSPTSDESDRWVVGVLHEILHVFVGKKTEKDSLLELGEWLGLRSRFKRALSQHPGIFYVSSKVGTYTVVLREGYKRGALIGDHPVMNLRNQYVHLMNSVSEEGKVGKVVQGKGGVDEAEAKGGDEGEGEGEGVGEDDGEGVGEHEEGACEVEDDSETDVDERRSWRGSQKIATGRRNRNFGKVKLDVDKPLRDSRRERLTLRDSERERSSFRVSQRERSHLGDSQRERSPLRDSGRERSPFGDSRRERSSLRTSGRERSSLNNSRRERSPLRDSGRERSPCGDSRRERSPLRNSGRERSSLNNSRRERSSLRDSGRERSPFGDSRRERSPLRNSGRERSSLNNSRGERSPLRDSGRERSPLRDSRRERSTGNTQKTGEKNVRSF